MNMKTLLAAALAATSFGAFADFEINLDLGQKPIKDMRTTGCGPGMGFNGAMEATFTNIEGNDDVLFVSNRLETADVMRRAGMRLLRLQCMNGWFESRKDRTKDGRYPATNPKAAFDFYKANGFKVFVCLECRREGRVKDCLEIVKWILDNGYKDVVAGFEMGNETYSDPKYASYAPFWIKFIDEAEKLWPKIPLGLNIGEYFENDPDVAQIRKRMMSNQDFTRDWTCDGAYFTAANFNKYSAQFVMAMTNRLDKIGHIIYHAYGAETPYSCSYYGFKRFRNFVKAFPELAGKKYWLTEIRFRSDEDNRCQRYFRETLITAHYALMALCQPETDAICFHQASALSGAIHQSNGRVWYNQWWDGEPWGTRSFSDFASGYDRPRLEVGSVGVFYRLYTEAIMEHPLFLSHGTSKQRDAEDTFYTSARVADQVYRHRRARREGKTGADVPKVEGEVEWVAATGNGELCLLMVNTKGVAEAARVTVKGCYFCAPVYRTLSCPEKYVDCRAIPGDGPVWKQVSWEDSQFSGAEINMELYKGIKPKCDVMTVEIAPHTVQTVTVPIRKRK